MNIFEEYLNKIKVIILKNQDSLKLSNINDFKGVTVEIPPVEFNFDLSDEILKGCVITNDGEVINSMVKERM